MHHVRQIIIRFAIAGGVFAALALPGLTAGSNQKQAQVLIVTGIDHPAHNWRQTAPALAEVLGKDPRLHVRTVLGSSLLRVLRRGLICANLSVTARVCSSSILAAAPSRTGRSLRSWPAGSVTPKQEHMTPTEPSALLLPIPNTLLPRGCSLSRPKTSYTPAWQGISRCTCWQRHGQKWTARITPWRLFLRTARGESFTVLWVTMSRPSETPERVCFSGGVARGQPVSVPCQNPNRKRVSASRYILRVVRNLNDENRLSH